MPAPPAESPLRRPQTRRSEKRLGWSWRHAPEALRLVGASRSGVSRKLRVRAERTRHGTLAAAAGGARGRNLRRRFSRFAPSLQRTEEIGLIRSDAATTMAYSRHQEQAHPLILSAAKLLRDGVVVVDRILRSGTRIRPAVIQQELASAGFECRQIRIARLDEAGVPGGKSQILFE